MSIAAKLWLAVGAVGIIAFFALGSGEVNNNASTVESSNTSTQKSVSVKYGDTVDVGHSHFEYLNTSGSSLVRGAWYDSSSKYMVINLNGTYYQYCRMPSSAWLSFKKVSSFGSHYNSAIKGLYDCRSGGIPSYAK